MLPDGTTRFTRSLRNSFGAVTNEISTYTANGAVAQRTNTFVYAPNGIDMLAATNAIGVQISSNLFNAYHEVCTNYDATREMTLYTYDSSQRLTSVTAPDGLLTTNFYGADGFLSQQIVVGYSTNSYIYSNDLVYTHTDTLGLVTTNLYDNLQHLTNSSDSRGAIVYVYSNLDLVRVVDRMGFTNSFGYDNMRRKTAETNALGTVTLYSYCTCGSLESVQDAAGNFTYFYYDNQGRRINTVYPDLYSVTNSYNLLGQITNTFDSAGMSITNGFNNQGLLVSVNNAFGQVQATIYDSLDRATNTVDANGVSISTTYDVLNRISAHSYPDSGVEQFGYTFNVAGLTSYTNQLNQATFYAYDTLGRKTFETNANTEVTRFTYDGAGDLLTLTDGKNQPTTWSYDQYGRVTNKVDAASNTLFAYGYDSDNRLTNRLSAAKGNTLYRYDSAGNLTNVVYPLSHSIAMAYDVLNRLTSMVDAVGTTVYSYDAASQLLSEGGLWPQDTVNFTYQNRLKNRPECVSAERISLERGVCLRRCPAAHKCDLASRGVRLQLCFRAFQTDLPTGSAQRSLHHKHLRCGRAPPVHETVQFRLHESGLPFLHLQYREPADGAHEHLRRLP